MSLAGPKISAPLVPAITYAAMRVPGEIMLQRGLWVPPAPPVNPFARVSALQVATAKLEPLTYLNSFDTMNTIAILLDGILPRDVVYEMTPEEAAAKLRDFLDTQAEAFRRTPRVYYATTDFTVRRQARRYLRIFAVGADGALTCLDFWVRRAARVSLGTREEQRVGQYTPERGFAVDPHLLKVKDSDIVSDLLILAGVGDDGYMRSIEIVEAA